MAIFFDHIQGIHKCISTSALTYGGVYVDCLTGLVGYIPKDRTASNVYLDPITHLIGWKPAAGDSIKEDFLFADGTTFLFADNTQFEFAGVDA